MQSLSTDHSVLLVEADVRTSRVLAHMLEEDGYRVELAPDSEAAIARLCRSPSPEALITELQPRQGDGASWLRRARNQISGLPVLVLTNYPQLLNPALLGEPPPIVLTKPVGYGELREALAGMFPVEHPPQQARV